MYFFIFIYFIVVVFLFIAILSYANYFERLDLLGIKNWELMERRLRAQLKMSYALLKTHELICIRLKYLDNWLIKHVVKIEPVSISQDSCDLRISSKSDIKIMGAVALFFVTIIFNVLTLILDQKALTS